MKRRGYTFIELLISASIMAGVLMSTFMVYAVINRNGRSAQRIRSDSYDAATLVNVISEYGRYASPWLTEDDQPVCTSGLSEDMLKAVKYGTNVSGAGTTLWIAVRESNERGDRTGALLYQFSFVPRGTVVTTAGSVQAFDALYSAEQITAIGTGTGVCKNISIAANQSLLPDNLRVVKNPDNNLLTSRAAVTINGGSVGELTLETNEFRLPRFVMIWLMVASTEQVHVPYEFITTFTPRAYASEFITSL